MICSRSASMLIPRIRSLFLLHFPGYLALQFSFFLYTISPSKKFLLNSGCILVTLAFPHWISNWLCLLIQYPDPFFGSCIMTHNFMLFTTHIVFILLSQDVSFCWFSCCNCFLHLGCAHPCSLPFSCKSADMYSIKLFPKPPNLLLYCLLAIPKVFFELLKFFSSLKFTNISCHQLILLNRVCIYGATYTLNILCGVYGNFDKERALRNIF